MSNLKEMGINVLCKVGKFGVGKSLTLGMYDFEIPKKLIESNCEKGNYDQKTVRYNK